ncbi:Transposon Tf2-6 polyprotein [Aduncisulcus paluster]|uniref:Transposon Tf2-6 polyprotein n=1 Tax=Aduncisulcus paluster TaxID=2918883 RepID=A0ABQ5K202_9EUKA|nr:Transposon Tf2-6 polyprotein [Aduncisulcus paluster]
MNKQRMERRLRKETDFTSHPDNFSLLGTDSSTSSISFSDQLTVQQNSIMTLTKLVEEQQKAMDIMAKAIHNLSDKLEGRGKLEGREKVKECPLKKVSTSASIIDKIVPNPIDTHCSDSSFIVNPFLTLSQKDYKENSTAGTRTRAFHLDGEAPTARTTKGKIPKTVKKVPKTKDPPMKVDPFDDLFEDEHTFEGEKDEIVRKRTTPGQYEARIRDDIIPRVGQDIGKPPILEVLSAKAYETFITQYKAYESRGGIRPIYACISDKVARLIISYYPDSDDDVLTLIKREVAPSTLEEFVARLSTFKLRYNNNMSSIHNYNLLFIQLVDAAPEVARRFTKVILRGYVEGIAPYKIRAPLLPLLDCEHVTLSMMMAKARSVTKSLIDTGWKWTYKRSKEANEHSESHSRKQHTSHQGNHNNSTGSKTKICNYCHKVGHTEDQCFIKKRKQKLKKLTSTSTIQRYSVQLGINRDKMVEFKALVDSGASGNFLHPKALAKIPNAAKKVIPCSIQVQHGEKSVITVSQQVTLWATISLNGRKTSAEINLLISTVTGDDELIIGNAWSMNFGLFTICIDDDEISSSEEYPEELARKTDVIDIHKMIPDSDIQDDIIKIVEEHAIVFDPTLPPEGSKLESFKVELEDPDSTWSTKPRRLCPAHQAELEKRLFEDTRDDIIEPSSSHRVCAPVFVPKRDGTTRMCINFIPLNRNTIPLPYPLPNVEELMSHVSNCHYFGSIDMKSGFHQIVVEPSSRPLLAFTCKKGIFQYKKMPFGTRNSSAHFQRAIYNAFSDLIPFACLIFVDDILIKGETKEAFLTNLNLVLDRLESFNIRAKPSKCLFGVEKIEFLGREVSSQGIRVAESRISDLRGLKSPTNKKQVQQVLGLFNYYRLFIKNYASRISEITSMTRKGVKFHWNDTLEATFQQIKEDIISRTLLFHIDYSKKLFLQTDASDTGVGGVLFQIDPKTNEAETIMFISKTLSSVERRWPTNEQEAYAVKFCVERAQHYLRGAHFTLQTDHANLRFMQNSKSPKVCRWNSFLNDFSFDVVHIPGKDNIVADAMSRIGHKITLKRLVIDEGALEEIKKAQLNLSDDEKEAYSFDEGYFRDNSHRIIIPRTEDILKRKVFDMFHGAITGHHGAAQTQFKIQNHGLSWSTIANDCKEWVSSCITCHKIRDSLPKRKPAFSTEREYPFHTLCIDTMGPFPDSELGHKYIIVIVDAFTRWCELLPTKTAESREVVDFLFYNIIARYGVPKEIISDSGRQYSNYLSDHLYDTFGIVQHCTTPDHPEANGRVERVNREIKQHSQHSALGCSPDEMLYGSREVTSFISDWETSRKKSFDELPKSHLSVDEYVKDLTDNISSLHKRARIIQKSSYDDPPEELKKGTWVIFKKFPPPKKLELSWDGPYEIILKTSDRHYKVRSPLGEIRFLHSSDVKAIPGVTLADATAAVAFDLGLRLPERILSQKGRGRGLRFLTQCVPILPSKLSKLASIIPIVFFSIPLFYSSPVFSAKSEQTFKGAL